MKNITIETNGTTYIYKPLPKPRTDNVVAELIGYRKNGKTYLY